MVKERGLARLRGEDVPHRYEVKILTKDGKERWVDYTGQVFEYQQMPAVLGVAIDITERKKAEESLKASYHELGKKIEKRTAELYALNKALKAEIAERERTEQRLQKSEEQH
ncbi:MAG: PAS domain S-box protein [Aliifodinibius sp.]|nr:PAS domain S-box protein [Fodinibius sp.]